MPNCFSYSFVLQTDLGLTQSQAVHVVSHCPYLIAQYARYKGRDVFATAKALMEVGYTLPKLVRSPHFHSKKMFGFIYFFDLFALPTNFADNFRFSFSGE